MCGIIVEVFQREQRMTFVSLTRLRIRSFRFVPLFALHTWRSLRQIRRARGFQTGAILADRGWTFWTMTVWDSEESMRQFMISGPHKAAMPHLVEWCDEASVAHWTQSETGVPSWIEADRRMREGGRSSKVRNPSPRHATLNFRAPRTTAAGKITRS
jgi:heme-degrading monooxygenase HmoA